MPFNIFNKKDHPMNPPSMSLNLGLGGLKPKSTSITNDYTISSRTLGVGINGKVVECFCKKTHQKYALKALRKSAKAFREVSLHWKVRTHANIVNVIDVYENTFSGTKCYLMVMECMEGGELFERIQAKGDSGFTEKEASKITRQICEALLVLHNSNIAHRDVKPENLLYRAKDIGATLKLTDFGFASEIIAGQLKTPCFTPYYAAPEVLGPEKYDMSCDMWSLGVIIYILLCGYPPFHTEGGAPMSPGMKKKIRQGDYNFPDPEWTYVSSSAKGLIRGLLCTDVLKRLDIKQCMNHPWIKDNDTVPETPLMSARILNEEEDMWSDKKEEMSNALNAMRIDYDNVIRIGDMSTITMNNPILKRRQNRKTENPNLSNLRQTVPTNQPDKQVDRLAKNKGFLSPGLGTNNLQNPTPSPRYIKPYVTNNATNLNDTITNGYVIKAPPAAFKPKTPANIPLPKLEQNKTSPKTSVEKQNKHPLSIAKHQLSNPQQHIPDEIFPKKYKVTSNVNELRRSNSASSVTSTTESNCNNCSPYWSDWEEYTSGSVANSENYENYVSQHFTNMQSSSEKPKKDEDVKNREEKKEESKVSSTASQTEETSHDSSFSSDSAHESTPSASRPSPTVCSPGSHLSPGDDKTLSGDLSSLANKMKEANTPEPFMDVMVALNLIAQDVEKIHSSVRTIGARQCMIKASISRVESKMSYVEDQVIDVHDKIEYVCNNLPLGDSTGDESSGGQLEYKNEKSKL